MKNYVFSYTDKDTLIAYCNENKISSNHTSLLIQIFTAFHDTSFIQTLLDELNSLLPNAVIIGSTTDGEIANGKVHTNETIISFTLFTDTTLTCAAVTTFSDSYNNGQKLAELLIQDETQLLIVFTDGLHTNGEKLLDGINDFNASVKVAGGMAGDYSSFTETFVFNKDIIISEGAVGVSLNGKRLKIFNDHNYNWQKIGKKFIITKCEENRVYTIDGKSAVDLYKEYLGEPIAEKLPAVGIEFPLIHHRDGVDIARAVLFKHDDGSLSFGGNMYEGEEVYLGYGDPDEIMKNAYNIPNRMASFSPEAIFVYSCMARRHFLGNSIEEELIPLQSLAPISGFFTYGEFFFHKRNQLLNQTLTVVGISEDHYTDTKNINMPSHLKKEITYNSVNALIHLINKTSNEIMDQKVFSETYSRFEQLFEHSGDGLLVMTEDKLIECNQKILLLFNYKNHKSTFLEQPIENLFVVDNSTNIIRDVSEYMHKSHSSNYLFEMECIKYNGDTFWSEIMFTKIVIEKESFFYVVFRDISQRKEMELELRTQRDKLYYTSYHDDLTGLANRTSIMETLQKEIVNAKQKKLTHALLFFDLDGLKVINDSLGHDIGDKLIVLVSKRIQRAITSDDIVARLGGDEFLILLKDVNEKKLTSQSEKILGSIREEIILDMHHLYVSASIGIAVFSEDIDDAHILLKYADSAMYEAKEKGRNQYQFYTDDLTEKAYAQVKLAKEFRRAIKEKEFEVYYQPQIDLKNNHIVGVEALIRWNHPENGFITPINFLKGIEKANLLARLDKWVMNHAMKDVENWYAEGLNPGKLALNISMSEVEDDKWERRLIKVMSRLNFDPKWLEMEITETEIMKHPELVITRLMRLREYGISIAIDDFGTGYSSLSQLKQLPFDKLKVDKVFVDDVFINDASSMMFNTIITLAKNINTPVLAEGVETKEQADYLLSEGCQFVQGYYYYKPMSAQKLKELLIERKKAYV